VFLSTVTRPQTCSTGPLSSMKWFLLTYVLGDDNAFCLFEQNGHCQLVIGYQLTSGQRTQKVNGHRMIRTLSQLVNSAMYYQVAK